MWWDQDDLPTGINFKVAIRRAIKDATQLVFCMSSQVAERVRNGTYDEIRPAIARIQELAPDNNFLIPVRFDDCEFPDFTIDATTTLPHLGTRTSGSMGKFVYAAPESQESANTVDVRADEYSFALTVTQPHLSSSRRMIRYPPASAESTSTVSFASIL